MDPQQSVVAQRSIEPHLRCASRTMTHKTAKIVPSTATCKAQADLERIKSKKTEATSLTTKLKAEGMKHMMRNMINALPQYLLVKLMSRSLTPVIGMRAEEEELGGYPNTGTKEPTVIRARGRITEVWLSTDEDGNQRSISLVYSDEHAFQERTPSYQLMGYRRTLSAFHLIDADNKSAEDLSAKTCIGGQSLCDGKPSWSCPASLVHDKSTTAADPRHSVPKSANRRSAELTDASDHQDFMNESERSNKGRKSFAKRVAHCMLNRAAAMAGSMAAAATLATGPVGPLAISVPAFALASSIRAIACAPACLI